MPTQLMEMSKLPDMPDEITVAELGRRIDQIERQIGQNFSRLDRQLESLAFVHRETYGAERSAMQADLDDLKDKIKWISRTVAGSLITAITAAIVALAARGGL